MKKYYAVIKGFEPGVYDNWDDCKRQIDGYPNAVYKGFELKREANKYFYKHINKLD